MTNEKRARRAKRKAQINRYLRAKGWTTPSAPARGGNPDSGCPFTGKDRFGGMLRKFNRRLMRGADDSLFCTAL